MRVRSEREVVSRSAPRVALVSGFWGQNIGNAYFNVGGLWILQQLFGEDRVAWIQDQPGYVTFHDQSKGNPRNDLEFLKHLDVDYIVLQGPLLTSHYRALWEPTFRELSRRGTRILLIGAAFFRYTPEEIAAARSFVEEFPPVLISTRDTQTYEIVKGWVQHTYDGIDSAFFAPCAYAPFQLEIEPYITVNFDRYPEPTICTTPTSASTGDAGTFSFNGFDWRLRTPRLQDWLSHRGKAQAYIGHLLDTRSLPTHLGDHLVIRPEHRSNPRIGWKIYKQPNAVVSDEPFTYFNLYANTALTLSDRVHACVATLAYGRPAMLFSPSPRTALFDRLDLGRIRQEPVRLDSSRLQAERDAELAFLRGAIGIESDASSRIVGFATTISHASG